MKATVEAARLKKLAAKAARVVRGKITIPILSNMRITAKDGAVTLDANNLEYSLTAELPADVSRPGAETVNASEFAAWCNLVPDGAQVTLEADGPKLRASAGSRRASFATLPADEFPPLMEPVEALQVDPAALADAVRFAMPAMSREDARWYLVGVALSQGHVVATDGHVMHVAPLVAGADAILPAAHLPAILDALDTDGATFGATEARWSVRAGSVNLAGKCIDGSFPDWTRIIPQVDRVAAVPRDDLAGALDAATIGRDGPVVIAGDDGGDCLRLAGTRDLGDATAECAAAELVEFRAVATANQLRATLAVMPVGEVVISENATLALRVEPADGDGRFAIIMQQRG